MKCRRVRGFCIIGCIIGMRLIIYLWLKSTKSKLLLDFVGGGTPLDHQTYSKSELLLPNRVCCFLLLRLNCVIGTLNEKESAGAGGLRPSDAP